MQYDVTVEEFTGPCIALLHQPALAPAAISAAISTASSARDCCDSGCVRDGDCGTSAAAGCGRGGGAAAAEPPVGGSTENKFKKIPKTPKTKN